MTDSTFGAYDDELDALLRNAFASLNERGDRAAADTAAENAGEDGFLGRRYRVLGELGRGGVGTVHRAFDTLLRREVAVKVLDGRHRDRPALIERFLDEARIGSRLEHPGIVAVHDMGLTTTGLPFFVMELLAGRTLAELLRDDPGRLGADQRLDVFEQICRAVAHAHERGVIHRDLKPSNIVVGDLDEVQVVDWGLAKVLAEPGEDRPRKASAGEHWRSATDSSTGSVLGTPAYMSPEQARGQVTQLDRRTDVFALGAILCELITGQPPYPGGRELAWEHARAGDLDAAWRAIDASSFSPTVRAITRACLQPDPARRPIDARDVAARIAAHRHEIAERLRAAELRAVAERKARRWQLTAGLVVLVAAGSGAVAWALAERRAGDRALRAARTVDQLVGEAEALQASKDQGPEVWNQIEARLARAAEVASSPEAGADTRARAVEATARIGGELEHERQVDERKARQREITRELVAIRDRMNSSFEFGRADREYTALFAEMGVVVGQPFPVHELEGAEGKAEIVRALNAWAACRLRTEDPDAPQQAQALRELAWKIADPDDARLTSEIRLQPSHHLVCLTPAPVAIDVRAVLVEGGVASLRDMADMTYRSSDPDVATVDDHAVVQPLAGGRTVITVQRGDVAGFAIVEVSLGDTTTRIEGTVVGPDGAPLAGAEVGFALRGATCDDDGRFAFDDVPTRMASGYVDAVKRIGVDTWAGRAAVMSASALAGASIDVGRIALARGAVSDRIAVPQCGDTNTVHLLTPDGVVVASHRMGFGLRSIAREPGGDWWIAGNDGLVRARFDDVSSTVLAEAHFPGAVLFGIAVAPDGDVFLSDTAVARVLHFAASGALRGVLPLPREQVGQLTIARAASGSKGYFVYATCTSPTSYTSDVVRFSSAEPGRVVAAFPGNPVHSLAVHPDGMVWIPVDMRGPHVDRLCYYDLDFKMTDPINYMPALHGGKGSMDVCITPDGVLWVPTVDGWLKPSEPEVLYRFDPVADRLTDCIPLGGPGESVSAEGCWVDGRGSVWVPLCGGRTRLFVYPRDGRAPFTVTPSAAGSWLSGIGDPSGYDQAFHLHPNADFDGDGIANRTELEAGRDPFVAGR